MVKPNQNGKPHNYPSHGLSLNNKQKAGKPTCFDK